MMMIGSHPSAFLSFSFLFFLFLLEKSGRIYESLFLLDTDLRPRLPQVALTYMT